jgi:hypothetical protein
MDILNEVVTGRTRQTRHLKSHHLQNKNSKVDLLSELTAEPVTTVTTVNQQGSAKPIL